MVKYDNMKDAEEAVVEAGIDNTQLRKYDIRNFTSWEDDARE